MPSNGGADREADTATLDRWDAVQAELAELSFDVLTGSEALAVKDRLETGYRRQAAVDQPADPSAHLAGITTDVGGKNWSGGAATCSCSVHYRARRSRKPVLASPVG
jgi:hypothetical protein